MSKLTDQELIEELLYRFSDKRRILEEQNRLMHELTTVNQKLSSSEKLKSLFLSNIRNEINNPISSILGLSKNLTSLSSLDLDKVKSNAKLIYSEAFNLDFQFKNIFIAADLEAGDITPNYTKTDISEVIHSVIDSFSHIASKKKIKINYTSTDTPYFNSDSEKLYLIISNLLSNAIEFNNEESEVNINHYIKNNTLNIQIKDFGIGIPKELQKKVFDRFTQLETGTTKSHPGQGLGLSITKALMELVEAKISIDSKIGEGTTIYLEFPAPDENQVLNDFSDDGNEFFFDTDEKF